MQEDIKVDCPGYPYVLEIQGEISHWIDLITQVLKRIPDPSNPANRYAKISYEKNLNARVNYWVGHYRPYPVYHVYPIEAGLGDHSGPDPIAPVEKTFHCDRVLELVHLELQERRSSSRCVRKECVYRQFFLRIIDVEITIDNHTTRPHCPPRYLSFRWTIRAGFWWHVK